jgi:biotin-dependent carboxylase-like uncharacterized protein
MIEVLEAGPQTTVQDGGRPGHLAKGIPPAGAQDALALALANLLVGNRPGPPPLSLGDPGHAGLEMPLRGPTLRFAADALIAITGAAMEATLDGEPVPRWRAVAVPAGGVLRIGLARRGVRGYLAVSGGIDVPPYLGSRATHVRGGQGGFDGRALRTGDRLPLGPPPARPHERAGWRVREERIPPLAPWALRVVPGPQDELFTDEAIELFYATAWKLSPVADRMGFRFQGPLLTFRERPAYLVRDAGSGPSDIVDDIIPVGGIQVPGGVEPIVMGVENPTAGGYAKIATVVSADLGRVGQMRPGEEARFVPVSAEEAVRIGLEQWALVAEESLAGSGA